ncbi:alpha-1,4-glucan--maltose-1-phosphate maltosyltransferase [Flavobacterium aquatile]|uniref:Alpha-1,4-glucan:maltose-1-phosphate maltosyltransferase n=1 Tax=Flavobacterium aquatile LMG 4008 = ATCC 11947 TaxID=1453498 RepID=A0A095UY47_9FLAO|nr:alpha-1,4-glucan--maltose-1-phosphate maltosyltransferase [Flavobacterium aquatile]KGD67510.1 alpha-amlyase [Flavobacterium aquatile LMG 4008 = ATCC 11947]OXA65555.1 alpha-1,4-glucan--maltose-1-phosphate maltosyltransferase [Flavobacterium aquatile LMG 4008 = ATCC 11947]GEC79954.1 alpha-1,4-glucan:maltose-1-phosphate maltosyltransferase [Flavobacterium aquatile]
MQNQTRIIIENIKPQLDGGLFQIKRIVGQIVTVTADVFSDGHDVVECCVKFKHEKDKKWSEVRLNHISNDEWIASFKVEKQGIYTYFIEGWVDYALNWQHGTERKINDNQHVKSELLEGAEYCSAILKEVTKDEKAYLNKAIKAFQNESEYNEAIQIALSNELHQIFKKYPTRILANASHELQVYVDRKKALFSTWYEFFPRSSSSEPGKHGTFKDCEVLLPRVAEMGFDTLYFPPIHPIGEVNRKGKNNATNSETGDVGSPWGIGSQHGGHKSTHPELGTIDDFKSLVKKAKALGIEVAMDYALQAAPDHPYVKDFPQWFKWRPDGTVQYAENPPKKYQDIQPIYFESSDWKNLWKELLDVALFWIEECDIKVFRVDNPHTKPFYFWGWLISEIKKKHPDVLFLAEAFTRPKIMHELAKQGFTQSYSYFTWRNSKAELIEYVEELTKTDQKEFFRANFWPNTPDINPYPLQSGNESIFLHKYFLAATLSSNVGIYGPVYEYLVHAAMPGKEEYHNSEKYEIYHWDWNVRNKMTMIISRINKIRHEYASLQQTTNIQFCSTDNDQVLAYYKFDDEKLDETLMICSIDPYYAKQVWVQLPLNSLGLRNGQPIKVTDLITGNSYIWDKEWNFVELHPALPFHLFKIQK